MDCKSLILYVFLIVFTQSCGSFSPERSAHVKITTKSGESIYVNRLSRGITYDVMWITANSGECRTFSKGKDILIERPLYYKFLQDGSFCIINTYDLMIPKDFPIEIKQEIIHPKDWRMQTQERYKSGDIQQLLLDLPDSDPCAFRWMELRDLFTDKGK
jgi:CRISPR/Cas system-associated exonuclease Cas4 (RecB family)